VSHPIIGVTLHGEAPAGRPPRLCVNRAYVEALERAGGVALAIPAGSCAAALERLYALCDGLLLPGGDDVTPQRYGETPREGCNVHADAELDGGELELLQRALDDDKPVLGICRGLQVLNVALGGSLWQDLSQVPGAAHPRSDDYAELPHEMRLEPDSLLHDMLRGDSVAVNSLHHQAVHRLAPTLRASGVAPDGLVEGVEMPGRRFVVALQSHPEELLDRASWAQRLFSRLVAASGA